MQRPIAVRVCAPARLHLGFLDLHGGLGRRFGSVGLSVTGPATALRLHRANRWSARGSDAERALGYARKLASQLDLPGAAEVVVEHAIPAHAGLGSGTQLALAVGTALTRVYRHALSTDEIAGRLERGARSGIGIGAFEQGGLLVDGGRGDQTMVPPLVTRLLFPDDWRIVLVFDPARAGASGEHEQLAFAALPEFPAERAAALCHRVLMRLLPAVMEHDLDSFGITLSELQAEVGDYFAPIQGGRYSSPAVADAIAWLAANGATGCGQSSWGPTGFAFCADELSGQRMVQQARRRWSDCGLRFQLARARNGPATIELLREPERTMLESLPNVRS